MNHYEKAYKPANSSIRQLAAGRNAIQLQDNRVNKRKVAFNPVGSFGERNVIQLMKPEGPGIYIIDKEKYEYRGDAVDEDGYYKFFIPGKSRPTYFKEEEIASKVPDTEQPLVTTPQDIVGPKKKKKTLFSDIDKVKTYEKEENEASDQLLSGEYDENPGEFETTYERKIRGKHKNAPTIDSLIEKAKGYLKEKSADHVGLWRFHKDDKEYESHAFQEAQQQGKTVDDETLKNAQADPHVPADHMYKSSSKSVGISFSRSIDTLIDQQYHQNADSLLRKIIFGKEGETAPAAYLSFTAIPKAELKLPEKVRVPKTSEEQEELSKDDNSASQKEKVNIRDRKGEARLRSMSELEAMHLPGPGSGGKTYPPLFRIPNPFVGQFDEKK